MRGENLPTCPEQGERRENSPSGWGGVGTKSRAESREEREKPAWGLRGDRCAGDNENIFGRANTRPTVGVRPASKRRPGRICPRRSSGPSGMPRENPANITTNLQLVGMWKSCFSGRVTRPRQGHGGRGSEVGCARAGLSLWDTDVGLHPGTYTVPFLPGLVPALPAQDTPPPLLQPDLAQA